MYSKYIELYVKKLPCPFSKWLCDFCIPICNMCVNPVVLGYCQHLVVSFYISNLSHSNGSIMEFYGVLSLHLLKINDAESLFSCIYLLFIYCLYVRYSFKTFTSSFLLNGVLHFLITLRVLYVFWIKIFYKIYDYKYFLPDGGFSFIFFTAALEKQKLSSMKSNLDIFFFSYESCKCYSS